GKDNLPLYHQVFSFRIRFNAPGAERWHLLYAGQPTGSRLLWYAAYRRDCWCPADGPGAWVVAESDAGGVRLRPPAELSHPNCGWGRSQPRGAGLCAPPARPRGAAAVMGDSEAVPECQVPERRLNCRRRGSELPQTKS